ncbi:MAG: LLM class flavin-dependent oxidoreductase [Chloroflexota bacterium]|nr:LLM class flavin-dependent oxidoreductase [Dehalococcoidia bacterium]MEE3249478.1 LLM class flavin-dependent oxidoreductase [Chloroflexota bacterium]
MAITFGVSLSVDDYWDIPEFARRAEALGYGRVTMGEHIMDGNPPRPTLLNLPAMAAAAGATSNLRVMTGIVIAPLYHPVTLAKMVATVDQVSSGRLDFGIGISGQRGTKIEFDAVGVDVHTRGKRTDEMLQVMQRLFTEEHVSHHGDFFDFDDVSLLPFPAQKPYPPVWVSGRSEAAMRRAGVMGDGWYPYLFTVRRIKASNDMVRQYAAEAGRDLTGFNWGLNQPTAISSDGSEALELAVSNVGERYVTAERSAESIAKALCIAGTPDDCVKAVEERIEAGVEHINLGFLASEPDAFYRQMELFASQVIPKFQR